MKNLFGEDGKYNFDEELEYDETDYVDLFGEVSSGEEADLNGLLDEEGLRNIADTMRSAIIGGMIDNLSDEINKNIREFAIYHSRNKKDKQKLKALHKEIGNELSKLTEMVLKNLELAYNKNKDRKGLTINGTFIKEEDL